MKNYSVKFLYRQGTELATKRFRTEADTLPEVVDMLGIAINMFNFHNPSREIELMGFLVTDSAFVKDLSLPTLEELALCQL